MGNTQRSRDRILREVANLAANALLDKAQSKLVVLTRVKVCAQCPLNEVCAKPCSKALKFASANRGPVIRALAAWN